VITVELSVFFFRSMQLACFLSGAFMAMVSLRELWLPTRFSLVTRPRAYFAIIGLTLGLSSVLGFLPRLIDSMVYYLDPPSEALGPAAVFALLLLYCSSAGIFCALSGKPRRSFTVFLLIMSSSFAATYLEYIYARP
jgi:hypothetical protein